MKFPITREALQAISNAGERGGVTNEELKEEELQKVLTIVLERFCKNFRESVKIDPGKTEYIWRDLYLLDTLHWSSKYLREGEDYTPQFLQRLKDTFIGCDIYIDSSKSSLIVSWY